MITLRPAAERGHAQHGWLDSWHSISFAPHRHQDMEIISYVLDGELEHRDSLGTGSIIRPGDVQRMSAGRGVTHSEFNPSQTDVVHFLQIWIMPAVRGIVPEYEQRHVSESDRRGRLRLIASPDGAGESLRIHQDARVYAGLLDGAESAALTLAPQRLGYVHLARGALSLGGQKLQAGDAALLRDQAALHLSDARAAEVLVFDLPNE
jgi:redox-sensitive bicupin YhaK (pirin superfamily)